jgi:hypothetical protein
MTARINSISSPGVAQLTAAPGRYGGYSGRSTLRSHNPVILDICVPTADHRRPSVGCARRGAPRRGQWQRAHEGRHEEPERVKGQRVRVPQRWPEVQERRPVPLRTLQRQEQETLQGAPHRRLQGWRRALRAGRRAMQDQHGQRRGLRDDHGQCRVLRRRRRLRGLHPRPRLPDLWQQPYRRLRRLFGLPGRHRLRVRLTAAYVRNSVASPTRAGPPLPLFRGGRLARCSDR